jgi:nucleoside-diphosphate-sugar epimerase
MSRFPAFEDDLRAVSGEPLPWETLAGKTVLVTGASGFLPSCMVETLLWINDHFGYGKKIKVLALARDRAKTAARFGDRARRDDFELLLQDVCTPLPPGVRADVVIHAASQASPKYYGPDPVGTLLPNTTGTHLLLESALRMRAERFLFVSSSEVYGTPATQPVGETGFGPIDPVNVRSCYAESKRMGETMTACWHHQFGLSTAMVRPFHTYGPGMDLADGRVFADFVSDVVAGRDIRMKSDGSAIRAFCYLSDAISGFFHVLLKGGDGRAYNIGNPEGAISVLGLAELLVSLFPEKKLKVIRFEEDTGSGYLKSPVQAVTPDIAAAAALGWRPSVGLEEGFTRTIRRFSQWDR